MTNEVKTETKKKATNGKSESKPAQVIREGGIAASIWLREASTGFAYYEYSLSRSWKKQSTGETGYANNFFAKHQEQLQSVIQKASAWIAENEQKLVQVESLAA